MTEPASDELIAEIEAKIENVPDWPWGYQDMPLTIDGQGPAEPDETYEVVHEVWSASFATVANCYKQESTAQYIALCHPGNIAALIARIRQQDERIKVMDEALCLYREAVRIDVKMEGPFFMGCNLSALKRAWDCDKTTSAARKEPT